MKSPEQLKGAIRNIAKEKNLRSQEILQMFLFERILERLSLSKYKNNFILKGGLLISSLIGIQQRTTLDMDTTIKGIRMDEEKIISIIREIISMDIYDGMEYIFERIEPIRKDDEYHNFRIHLIAKYGKINSPIKIDITTGDEIIPKEITYKYPLMFDNKTIPIMTYTLETILAEKYETIIHRNIATTRARDYYDLHILFNSRKNDIRYHILKEAILKTSRKRQSIDDINNSYEIIQDMKQEKSLFLLWDLYVKENSFASGLSFEDVLKTVEEISNVVLGENHY